MKIAIILFGIAMILVSSGGATAQHLDPTYCDSYRFVKTVSNGIIFLKV